MTGRVGLGLLATAVAGAACAAGRAREDAPPPVPPASALAALVQVLEALPAAAPVDAEVRLRAAESAALDDPRRGRPHVRVVLDLTVFAADAARAHAGYLELEHALRRAVGPDLDAHGADPERSVLALGAPWTFPRRRADLPLSFSGAVRLELLPGPPLHPPGTVRGPGRLTPEEEVRRVAEAALGAVETSVDFADPAPGARDVKIAVVPRDRERHPRERIAALLPALEGIAPSARLTHVSLEPAEGGLWNFATELTLRVPVPATR